MTTAESFEKLNSIAVSLKEQLESVGMKCAFAESCTGGMVAAAMAGVPGVSAVLCGSMVTYRDDSKSSWIGVDPALIAQHSAESGEVTSAMVVGLLEKTPEADVGAAVTGHLGPDAPADKDGKVFVAVARRGDGSALVKELKLVSSDRIERQIEAAVLVLETLFEFIR